MGRAFVRVALTRHGAASIAMSPTICSMAKVSAAVQWWSVRVELLGGAGTGDLWPAPGRIFAASTDSTFHDFAEAIDDAFAR